MISSKAAKIRTRLLEFSSIMTFSYQGIDCDIDPYNPHLFHISCNGVERDLESIDEVMNGPHFSGKSLSEIADDIEIQDW